MYCDFDLEAEIYQLCSPYIANKIILEYLRAKDNTGRLIKDRSNGFSFNLNLFII